MTTIATQSDAAVEPGTEALGVLLKRAHKASNQLLRRLLEPLGLTPMQAAVLRCLFEQESLSLNELAERLRSDAPTLSGVVECLVTAGLVERRADASDRRRMRLFATEKARERRGVLREAEEQREAALTRALSPAEVSHLKALLQRVARTSDE